MPSLPPVSFWRNQLPGFAVVNVFAALSCLALASLALRVAWLAIQPYLSRNISQAKECVFFQTQLGHYAACLLIANILVDAAGLVGIFWLLKGSIIEGWVCTTQAIIRQAGNCATAYFTVSIAVHTFNSLVLRKRQSVRTCATAITFGWISSGLLAAGPLMNPRGYTAGSVYGADRLSCGVRPVYLKSQFFLHLLPIFVASILSAVLYSVIFLVLRGTLNIRSGIKFTLDPNERWTGTVDGNYHRFVARIARSMLWYPIAYIVLLVPYSVTRLLDISGFSVAFGGLVFAYVCWFMLGVVNVLLLYNTFRVLGPAFDAHCSLSIQRDTESFGTPAPLKQRSPSMTSGPLSKPMNQLRSHPSDQNLQRERTASAQSFYSYSSSPSIGRAITPMSEFNRMGTTSPETPVKILSPIMTRTPVNYSAKTPMEHIRQGSVESLSLPVPPRRTRSPILHQPSFEHVLSGTQNSRQFSTNSIGVSEKEIARHSTVLEQFGSNWTSRPSFNDTSVNPALSAVNGSFSPSTLLATPRSPQSLPPQPRHTRSLSGMRSTASIIGPAPGRRKKTLSGPGDSFSGASEFPHAHIDYTQGPNSSV